MFKLKKGSLQTTVYTEEDKNSYMKAGWKLLEEINSKPKEEIQLKEEKELPSKYSSKYSYKK